MNWRRIYIELTELGCILNRRWMYIELAEDVHSILNWRWVYTKLAEDVTSILNWRMVYMEL